MGFDRPLEGRRIVVTRAVAQAAGLVARLHDLGAVPIACPAIAILPPVDVAPLDAAIARLGGYDWVVVTSVNGVRALIDRMVALGQGLDVLAALRVGAIGPATAAELARCGVRCDFVPSAYVAESLLAEIGDVVGRRFLLPRADIAREVLAQGLRGRGALVDEVVAYRTVADAQAQVLLGGLRDRVVDAVTFTSSSTVRCLLDGLVMAGVSRVVACRLLDSAATICIGPITAATARAESLRVDVVADSYTVDGVIDALVMWFAQSRPLMCADDARRLPLLGA